MRHSTVTDKYPLRLEQTESEKNWSINCTSTQYSSMWWQSSRSALNATFQGSFYACRAACVQPISPCVRQQMFQIYNCRWSHGTALLQSFLMSFVDHAPCLCPHPRLLEPLIHPNEAKDHITKNKTALQSSRGKNIRSIGHSTQLVTP